MIRQAVKIDPRQTRIVLTHDIDTVQGFDWVQRTAELETAHGFTSVWHVVGKKYRVNHNVLEWLAEHQFEIGLHGYNHDNKLIFLTEQGIRNRIESCRSLIDRYDMCSFRSPSFFRSETLFDVLGDYFTHDYSYLDSDIACPGGAGGCLTTKPFKYGALTHVVTTMSFVDPVLHGYDPRDLLPFWEPKMEWLVSCGGDIVVNTHPDPHFCGNPTMLAQYEALLQYLAGVRDRHRVPQAPSTAS